MATLILSAIGTAVAGPVGTIVGAVAGSVIDRALFAPSLRREGARLSDLSVQGSAYGAAVPLVYGRARVAGNVIWSTGLIESRHESRTRVGGKGGGSVTNVTYSYAASFAVALSARPIREVRRVWADGKLIRDSDGHLTVGGQMRLHGGAERQPPDPLMQAALGVAATPAHRGLAYVVFEQLELAEFANRIPVLTFEVVADDGPALALGTLMADLGARAGAGLDATAMTATATGFAVGAGASARDVGEALQALAPLRLVDRQGVLTLADTPPAVVSILDEDGLGAALEAGDPPARRTWTRLPETALPREISLGYLDPARDYQAGLQRARRLATASRLAEPADLPVVLAAPVAKQAAESLLARRWCQREQCHVYLPWGLAAAGPASAGLALEPGDRVAFAGEPARDWQVVEATIEAGRVALALVPLAGLAASGVTDAEPGAALTQPGTPHGPTTVELLDLPPLSSVPADSPRLHVAAAGASTGWRRASIHASSDGGLSYARVADIAARTVIGVTNTMLPAGATDLWDRTASVEVALLAEDMALASAPPASVLAGANLCLIGQELVQFTTAEQLDVARYRLSGLLRGRRGTEDAMADHVAGERFVLLGDAALATFEGSATLGQTLLVKALSPYQTLAEVAPVAATMGARALRPLSPVRLSATRLDGGDIALAWVRRSRLGFDWVDGADAPLAEESERYDVAVMAGATEVRAWRVATPGLVYTVADQIADFGAAPATLDVQVAQVSARVGAGVPARRVLTI